MTARGILLSGSLHPIDGLTVYAPSGSGGPSWNWLAPGDYMARPTPWIRQVLVHSTVGDWPMTVLPGAGAPGRAQHYADVWQTDPKHAGAHLTVDTNGDVYCMCDLERIAAYHAEASNPWSIGIEHCQTAKGEMYQATIDAGARLVVALCELLGIPLQMPPLTYRGDPLWRMETGTGPSRHQLGGPDCVGVFGHRNQTSERGRGDPGDAVMQALSRAGVRQVDYDLGEDLTLGRKRQAELNRLDSVAGNTYRPLVVDGVLGPSSIATMRRLGFRSWEAVVG
jgi:hypothetical protein